MQTLSRSRENRATTRLGLAANGDDIGKELARFENIEDGLRLLFGNVEAYFAHHLHHERIQCSRFQARALDFELSPTDIAQEGFGHLAARAVVDTDKEDIGLVHLRSCAFVGVAIANLRAHKCSPKGVR